MQLEMTVMERIQHKTLQATQEQERWKMQSTKQMERATRKKHDVERLEKTKQELSTQLFQLQEQSRSLVSERQQREEQGRRERLVRQRQAERAIQVRLREEEAQRLVDEERKRQDNAIEARAKASARVTDIRRRHSQTSEAMFQPISNLGPKATMDRTEHLREFEKGITHRAALDFQWSVPMLSQSLQHEILYDEGLSSSSDNESI